MNFTLEHVLSNVPGVLCAVLTFIMFMYAMYLYNIILAIFSMYSLHSADIQASKHLSARVHPQTIPKKIRGH